MVDDSSFSCNASDADNLTVVKANIVIVGGGIAGLATALALHRKGLKTLVLERADSLRTSGTSLGIWANGWQALEQLGVAHSLREDYTNINRVKIFHKDNNLKKEINLQDDTKWRHELRCVDRRHLLEELAKPLLPGTIRFKSTVVSIHKAGNIAPVMIIHLQDGTTISARVLIGCDGANSVVSRWLGLSPTKPAGYYTIRGVATYPERHSFEPVFQQIVGNGLRTGFAPIDATRIYWFISNGTCSQVPDNMHASENVRHEAMELLQGFPNTIIELVKRTSVETLIANTIRLRWLWPQQIMGPSFWQGGVTVAGDAMHPMSPDLAQGGCCALEDAVVLARLLSKAMKIKEELPLDSSRNTIETDQQKRIERALQRYTQERRERAWSLTAQAWLMGKVLNANSSFLKFIRDSIVLPTMQASTLVAHTQFDCGPLELPQGHQCPVQQGFGVDD